MIQVFITDRLREIVGDDLVAYGGESAGIDLYSTASRSLYIPAVDDESFELKQRQKTLIPTGLHLALPKDYVALIRERGSITKTPLVARAGVIDPGYTGEVFVNMINVSHETYEIEPGSKLPVQLLILPFRNDLKIVDEDTYRQITETSQRGEGKIGSSD